MPIPVALTPVAPFITNDPESASIPVLLDGFICTAAVTARVQWLHTNSRSTVGLTPDLRRYKDIPGPETTHLKSKR